MKRQLFFFVCSCAAASGFASGEAGNAAEGIPSAVPEALLSVPEGADSAAAVTPGAASAAASGFAGSGLSLKGSHFLSDPASPLQLKNYYSLYGGLIYKKEKGRLSFKTDSFAELSIDRTRQFYAAPRELFLSYRYDFQNRRFADSLTVYFGRHIKEWSRADSYWEFGTWNPLILYEPLYPTEAGLIGAFLDIASKQWLLELYAGGFHLPHVKPKFQKPLPGTNTLKSPNRFADIPPESVDLAGLDLEIDYSVRFFKEELFHDSYGVGLTWMSSPPEEERRLYLKGNFGWKPSNDVFLTRNTRDTVRVENQSKSGEESAFSIDQKIENQAVRQKIVSVESGARFDGFFGWVAFLQNKMSLSRALPPARKFVIKPQDHSCFSALAGKRFFLFQDIKTKIQAGWLHSFGLGRKESLAGQLINYKILNGFGLDVTAAVGGEETLERSLSFRYRLSSKTRNNLLSLNFLFHLLPKWHVGGGVNILTGRRGNKRAFLNRFRSADSVVWRTGYVF